MKRFGKFFIVFLFFTVSASVFAQLDQKAAQYRSKLLLDGVRTYTTVQGDTLSQIARIQYGVNNGLYFPLIHMANTGITDPDKIKPRVTLIIPDLQKNLENPSTREAIRLFILDTADFYEAKGLFRRSDVLRILADSLPRPPTRDEQIQKLLQQEELLQQQKAKLNEAAAVLSTQRSNLEARQRELSVAKQQITQDSQGLSSQQTAIDAQQRSIEEQQAALAAQAKHLGEQRVAVESQQRGLREKQVLIEREERTLAAQQTALEQQERNLAEQRAALAVQEQGLAVQRSALEQL